ncbi:hypothetical protein CB1_000880055 [Camelus ferus]|nr:hypothetical protein CB1_000880055 [Camelus ferus]
MTALSLRVPLCLWPHQPGAGTRSGAHVFKQHVGNKAEAAALSSGFRLKLELGEQPCAAEEDCALPSLRGGFLGVVTKLNAHWEELTRNGLFIRQDQALRAAQQMQANGHQAHDRESFLSESRRWTSGLRGTGGT